MQALKDKRKFGWNKVPKNHNCKKFGIQGSYHKNRNALHTLLFRTDGWLDKSSEIDWVVRDIKFYYEQYKEGVNLLEYIARYEYDKESFWKSTNGRYYHTLATHIEDLTESLRLRGDLR